VMTGGALTPGRGFHGAVWAFDLLQHVLPDVYLVVLGDGPDRPRLEQFARNVGRGDCRVRFAGARADGPDLLALADLVWVPHFPEGGTNLAREAAAAGVAVVAVRQPAVAEIVRDGTTGLLIDHADGPAGIARVS